MVKELTLPEMEKRPEVLGVRMLPRGQKATVEKSLQSCRRDQELIPGQRRAIQGDFSIAQGNGRSGVDRK